MSATAATVTVACFLLWEAPDGDVRLCDGGFLYFDAGSGAEKYEAEHPVWGTIADFGTFASGTGDMAEAGTLVFAPSPDAALADWWRGDLFDTRVRLWSGDIDSDGRTIVNEKLHADWLVDTVERRRGFGGQELLSIGLIARSEKFFLINEGNVCSERHHKSVFAGEDGFNNCTDLVGYKAWGTATPARGSGAGGGGGGFGPGGRSTPGGSGPRANLVLY